jgi:hypothetical protein
MAVLRRMLRHWGRTWCGVGTDSKPTSGAPAVEGAEGAVMIRPERVVLRRLRRLLRPPVAMRLHVGRSDEGDPARVCPFLDLTPPTEKIIRRGE